MEVDAAPQWSQEHRRRGTAPTRGVNLTVFATNLLFPYVAAVLVRLINLGSGLRRGNALPLLPFLPPPPFLLHQDGFGTIPRMEIIKRTMDPHVGQSCAHGVAACRWSRLADVGGLVMLTGGRVCERRVTKRPDTQ